LHSEAGREPVATQTGDWNHRTEQHHYLAKQLREAAQEFKDANPEGSPDMLYVQKSRPEGWRAAFCTSHDREMEMTRWSTGSDVVGLYDAFLAGEKATVREYAGDVISGWDEEWTDQLGRNLALLRRRDGPGVKRRLTRPRPSDPY
jgi:hypothetical protein